MFRLNGVEWLLLLLLLVLLGPILVEESSSAYHLVVSFNLSCPYPLCVYVFVCLNLGLGSWIGGKHKNDATTPAKLAAAWRTARVTTAPGPSRYTFAHFKAHALPGAEDLIAADASMISIPYKTGYSPMLWQQGINCMLEKKKGSFRVDKLRAILLSEAPFNMMNKIMGRDTMTFAE